MKASPRPSANKPIAPGQMKAIYALGRAVPFNDDELHNLVGGVTGKFHVSELTAIEAGDVIDRLKVLAGQDEPPPPDRATIRQIDYINSLAQKLGWSDPGCMGEQFAKRTTSPKRLAGFLEQRFHASHPKFLSTKNASAAIEALKAMLEGNRGERKTEG